MVKQQFGATRLTAGQLGCISCSSFRSFSSFSFHVDRTKRNSKWIAFEKPMVLFFSSPLNVFMYLYIHTLWQTNIAMENGPLLKLEICQPAMLVYQKVYIYIYIYIYMCFFNYQFRKPHPIMPSWVSHLIQGLARIHPKSLRVLFVLYYYMILSRSWFQFFFIFTLLGEMINMFQSG